MVANVEKRAATGKGAQKIMNSRTVNIGGTIIGGKNPVVVQSMTNTKTSDVDATVSQIKRLEDAGCEIVRIAVPDEESAKCIGKIKSGISIPLVADIHFRYELALIAAEEGVDKLRINPGNIGSRENVEKVVLSAKKHGLPIRIGVNSGSVEKDLLGKYKGPTAQAMVESAFRHVKILEEMDYRDIVVSLKAADVPTTIAAYRLMAEKSDYPLHVGITEAGTKWAGTIYSSVGIGVLLAEGIGNTIRVSLTADPVEEIPVAWEILKALKLRQRGPRVISCPTCGRTRSDLISLAEEVERHVSKLKAPLKIAVMGCEVNGPGEAADADVGVACGKGFAWVFRKGKRIKKVPEDKLIEGLMDEIGKLM